LQRLALFSALHELVARDDLGEPVVVSVLPGLETVEALCDVAELVPLVEVLDSTELVTLVELRESTELETLAD
jgi:hypothetical protein